jgi:hypothetical protein
MPTPGVGVLIDTDRLKSSNMGEQANPYFIDVDGERYYGSNPEDTLRQAKKALTRKTQTTNIIPLGVKNQRQTSVTKPVDADLKLLGLRAGATRADIIAAFKKASLAGHSNKGGAANMGDLTAAKNRLLERFKDGSVAKPAVPAAKPAVPAAKPAVPAAKPAVPAAKQLAIMNRPAKGGGKMRKSLKRKRVFRKKRSTTRKQLK